MMIRTRVAEGWDEPGDRGAILALPGGKQEAFLEIYYADRSSDFAGLGLHFRIGSLGALIASPPKTVSFEGPTARP